MATMTAWRALLLFVALPACRQVIAIDDKELVPPGGQGGGQNGGMGGAGGDGGMGGMGGSGACPAPDPTWLPPVLADRSRVVLWLDAAHGFDAERWCDRSGHEHHAVPTTTPPTPSADVYPAVRFGPSTTMTMPGPFGDFPEGTTWALVMRPTDDHSRYGGRMPLRLGQSFNPYAPPQSEPYDLMSLGNLGVNDDLVFGVCDPLIGSCRQAYTTDWYVKDAWSRTVLSVGSDVRLWVDGSERVLAFNGYVPPWPPPWSTPRLVGAIADVLFEGDIAEVIVFDRALSGDDVAELEAYWAEKRVD
jgi:hypothetical protein